MQKILFILFLFCTVFSKAQDSETLKVHFLYGSKPLKEFKNTEPKWFGGILGGHVGIEGDSERIINFLPNGKFHWFAKKKNKHSLFDIHNSKSFYSMFGGNAQKVKKAIVYIPVNQQQKSTFDSISKVYLNNTPYDYAFFGMRCGAAAYDILAQLNILPNYSYRKMYKKIFYPRKLRKKLFKKATENKWQIVQKEGSTHRKWEKD